MSYTKYNDRGTTVYLCWNCGRIHLEEIETQQCKEDMEFIGRCLDKIRKAKSRRVRSE